MRQAATCNSVPNNKSQWAFFTQRCFCFKVTFCRNNAALPSVALKPLADRVDGCLPITGTTDSIVTRLRAGRPGFESRQGQRMDFFLRHCVESDWGQAIIPLGTGGLFPQGYSGQNVKLTSDLGLVPRLRMCCTFIVCRTVSHVIPTVLWRHLDWMQPASPDTLLSALRLLLYLLYVSSTDMSVSCRYNCTI
jgi:hypothetical protein